MWMLSDTVDQKRTRARLQTDNVTRMRMAPRGGPNHRADGGGRAAGGRLPTRRSPVKLEKVPHSRIAAA